MIVFWDWDHETDDGMVPSGTCHIVLQLELYIANLVKLFISKQRQFKGVRIVMKKGGKAGWGDKSFLVDQQWDFHLALR